MSNDISPICMIYLNSIAVITIDGIKLDYWTADIIFINTITPIVNNHITENIRVIIMIIIYVDTVTVIGKYGISFNNNIIIIVEIYSHTAIITDSTITNI